MYSKNQIKNRISIKTKLKMRGYTSFYFEPGTSKLKFRDEKNGDMWIDTDEYNFVDLVLEKNKLVLSDLKLNKNQIKDFIKFYRHCQLNLYLDIETISVEQIIEMHNYWIQDMGKIDASIF
jgi:spore maturation protein CgeB